MERKVWLLYFKLISQNPQVRLPCVSFSLSKAYFQRCDYNFEHVALGFAHVALSFHHVALSFHHVALSFHRVALSFHYIALIACT